MAEVSLVSVTQDSIEALHQALAHDLLYTYIDDDRSPLDILRARLAWAEIECSPENPEMTWLYRLVCINCELVGCIELGLFPDGYGEIGVFTFLEHQSQGYATAALRLIAEEAWLRSPRVVLRAFTRHDNKAARKALEKAGFSQTETTHNGRTAPLGEVLYVRAPEMQTTPPRS